MLALVGFQDDLRLALAHMLPRGVAPKLPKRHLKLRKSQNGANLQRLRLKPAFGAMMRTITATALLCLGLTLGGCSSFSGFVADHWPRWAGGMPDDVPPRPGTPGYEEFIAHGQPSNNAARPASAESQPAPADVKTGVRASPAQEQAADDPNVVQRGGLY
jgi:hypothetical protein